MGLALKIPMLIRLLAENLIGLHTDTDSVDMAPFIGLALIADEEYNTYSFNWWDKDRVNGFLFCILRQLRNNCYIFRSQSSHKFWDFIILKQRYVLTMYIIRGIQVPVPVPVPSWRWRQAK